MGTTRTLAAGDLLTLMCGPEIGARRTRLELTKMVCLPGIEPKAPTTAAADLSPDDVDWLIGELQSRRGSVPGSNRSTSETLRMASDALSTSVDIWRSLPVADLLPPPLLRLISRLAAQCASRADKIDSQSARRAELLTRKAVR